MTVYLYFEVATKERRMKAYLNTCTCPRVYYTLPKVSSCVRNQHQYQRKQRYGGFPFILLFHVPVQVPLSVKQCQSVTSRQLGVPGGGLLPFSRVAAPHLQVQEMQVGRSNEMPEVEYRTSLELTVRCLTTRRSINMEDGSGQGD